MGTGELYATEKKTFFRTVDKEKPKNQAFQQNTYSNVE
jgi:hypothetical protein